MRIGSAAPFGRAPFGYRDGLLASIAADSSIPDDLNISLLSQPIAQHTENSVLAAFHEDEG